MGSAVQGPDAGQSPRLAALISGRGSNLRALVSHFAAVSGRKPEWLVVSNEPQADGLAWAKEQGLNTVVVRHRDFSHREAFDQALLAQLTIFGPDLVLLAGFMRILTPGFCAALMGRLLNIHPALLPAFTGLDTHARALASGVRVHGATVHAVTAELDHGPILAQGVVPVLAQDSPEQLAARVLEVEHRLYPQAVEALLSGAVVWQEDRWCWRTRTIATGSPDARLGFSPLVLHPLLLSQTHATEALSA